VRLFVALAIPASVREGLAALITEMRSVAPKAKWIRPENLHVTLKFMGEAPPEKLDAIGDALASVRSAAPVEVQFRSLGFFPNQKRARVLWAGVEASANLTPLAAAIDAAVAAVGFPKETRAFTPHLTLARFDPPGLPPAWSRATVENLTHDFGTLRTGTFHLIQSKLKRSGAEYTTLRSFLFVPET
jgi:RNA 2',3'-cyclic 3'-phosphodiesterase